MKPGVVGAGVVWDWSLAERSAFADWSFCLSWCSEIRAALRPVIRTLPRAVTSLEDDIRLRSEEVNGIEVAAAMVARTAVVDEAAKPVGAEVTEWAMSSALRAEVEE